MVSSLPPTSPPPLSNGPLCLTKLRPVGSPARQAGSSSRPVEVSLAAEESSVCFLMLLAAANQTDENSPGELWNVQQVVSVTVGKQSRCAIF